MARKSYKTALFLAWRYLFSKKEHNIINVISGISMIGIMVSTAALVVVLSVFNGMSDIIGGWFNALHADYEITLREGKSFATDSFPIQQLRQIPGVKAVNEIVCDLSLANYDDRQELLYLKGVPDNYFQTNHFEGMLVDGDTALYKLRQPCAIMGTGSAGKLEVNLLSYNLMKMYYPKRTKKNFANAAEAFNTRYIIPNGVICTNTNYDENYIFCPISFVRELMDYEGEVTSLEIQLKEGANTAKVRKQIADLAGEKYLLKDQQEQEDSLYKTMKSEKFMIYLILAFILILAAFNIIGALGMLILEKKTDTLNRKLQEADAQLEEIKMVKKSQLDMLERISGFSVDEAKQFLINSLKDEVTHEMADTVRTVEAQFKEEAEQKAREYIATAIQRCAADHTSEVTVSVVPLPNDEMKGRIIGREGRNIRTTRRRPSPSPASIPSAGRWPGSPWRS